MGISQKARGGIVNGLNRRWGIAQRLKAGLFAIAVSSVIIGISALATITSEQVDESVLASHTTPTADKSEATTKSYDASSAAPQETKKIIVPATPPKATSPAASATMATKKSAPKDCAVQQRSTAIQNKTKALRKESVRHKQAIRDLQSTGLLTRVFNPGMYSYRWTKEANDHKDTLNTVHKQFKQSLQQAHCTL